MPLMSYRADALFFKGIHRRPWENLQESSSHQPTRVTNIIWLGPGNDETQPHAPRSTCVWTFACFNIHLDNPAEHLSSQFLSLLSSFNLTQHVDFPTHEKNHILDLVITSTDSSLAPSLSSTHCSPSDHFPVFTKLSMNPTPLPPPTLHSFHRLHSIDTGSFLSDLKFSQLITDPPKSLGSLLNAYNSILCLLYLTSFVPGLPLLQCRKRGASRIRLFQDYSPGDACVYGQLYRESSMQKMKCSCYRKKMLYYGRWGALSRSLEICDFIFYLCSFHTSFLVKWHTVISLPTALWTCLWD